MRAIAAENLLAANHASAVDQPVQRAEGFARRRHGIAGGIFIGDVGHQAAGVGAQLGGAGLDGGGEIDQQHLGARLDQPLGGGRAQPGGRAGD
ncbi:hypothetical protein D3C80_1545660 [compost metagenome]